MSVETVQWVLRNSTEQRANRAVLLVLAEHAKRDGSDSYPSIATIAREAGVSRRTVHYALRDLEARGAVLRGDRSRWRTTIYAVLMRPDGAADASVQSVHGAVTAPVQPLHSDGAAIAPKPSLTTLSTTAARAREPETPDLVGEVLAVQAIFAAAGPPGCEIDAVSVENARARFPTVDLEPAARGCAEWLRHHRRKPPGLTFHRWLEREARQRERPPGRTRAQRDRDGLAALARLNGSPA